MIYLHHIRRTGGTSLIYSILAQEGNPVGLYAQVCQDCLTVNGKLIQGWNCNPSPNAYFAWSHEPAWVATLPRDVIMISILRDPVARLVSHYRALLIYGELGLKEAIPGYEWDWLGRDLLEFAGKISVEHSQRQLYMFSRDFDIEQAAKRIEALSYYFYLGDYDRGLMGLGRLLRLNLESHHISVPRPPSHPIVRDADARIQSELTPEVEKVLQNLLQPEYELLGGLSGIGENHDFARED